MRVFSFVGGRTPKKSWKGREQLTLSRVRVKSSILTVIAASLALGSSLGDMVIRRRVGGCLKKEGKKKKEKTFELKLSREEAKCKEGGKVAGSLEGEKSKRKNFLEGAGGALSYIKEPTEPTNQLYNPWAALATLPPRKSPKPFSLLGVVSPPTVNCPVRCVIPTSTVHQKKNPQKQHGEFNLFFFFLKIMQMTSSSFESKPSGNTVRPDC